MNKAAIALGLAGFAAAGVVSTSTLVYASSGPAGRAVATKIKCSPGSHVGQAVQKTSYLIVNKSRADGGRKYLKGGEQVGTTTRGTATICLRPGGTVCELAANTNLKILPSRTAIARLTAGSVTCKTSGGQQIKKDFETKAETIRLGTSGVSTVGSSALRAAGTDRVAAGASTGNLLSIAVGANGTVIKVGRGATVVARRNRLRAGVVLGRQEQVVVPKNDDPSQPGSIKLSDKERKQFAQLNALLPPVRDTTPPQAGVVRGPHDPSSIRSAKFAFTADEAGVIFSCSLDDEAFHVCVNGQRFDGLAPGLHKLAVTATDATGNVGSEAPFEWTIDSSTIAFTSERDGNREIYVMDPGGHTQTRLTFNKAIDQDPTWSPDRKQIAFHSDRDGNYEIYLMSADGNNQTRLTTSQGFDLNPSWSPDGTRIAFESSRDGNSEIYSMNSDGSDVRRLTFDAGADFDPAWSPDGTRIAFASDRDGNKEIYVMDADGSKPVRLTNEPSTEFNPAWSPDSTLIAFHSDQKDGTRQIYVMSPTPGSEEKRITFTGRTDSNPVWAPDGTEIAFQSEDSERNDEIYVVNVEDGELLRLTNDPADDLVPDWSRG